jgi:hypothetical protein
VSTSSTDASHRYASKNFMLPLTVTTVGMKNPPTEDSRNLISWDAVIPGGIRPDDHSQYNKVRIMVPAKVYRPDSDVPIQPPTHYLEFLLSEAAYGVHFSNLVKLTLNGRPATIVTATTGQGLDGSIGCPTVAANQTEGCYGVQPEIALRIAVIDIKGVPVVAWARTSAKAPDRNLFALFDKMVRSVRFRG